ncbi:MAG: IPExxxVDY family protein [Bacteroidetes bacterium]|nr:IPExxxVDY family protein [Bacteroidota bacterium]
MPKHDLQHFPIYPSDFYCAFIHGQLELHQLAWNLNHFLDLEFWRNDVLLNSDEAGNGSEHHCFVYNHSDAEVVYWLVANQGMNSFLFTKKPRPDFILVGKGETAELQMQQWMDWLKTKNLISLAYFVDDKQIQKMNWLLWLESNDRNNNNEEKYND